MRRKVIPLGIFVLCCLANFRAVAQERPAAPPSPPPAVKSDTARFGNPTGLARTLQGYIYGVVKKVDKGAIILDKTEFGDDQPFKLEPKTKFVRDGKPARLSDFKPGDMIFVKVKKDKKTHEMFAERVVTGVDPTDVR